VTRASVAIDGKVHNAIGPGLMILVGVECGDTEADMEWLAAKTAGMRIFNDAQGVMNLSVRDVDGEVLAISQFTLTASTRKGNRPGYSRAAGHDVAVPLYEAFCDRLTQLLGKEVKRGIFGADMKVELVNDGPVTIIIDSRLRE
jgi:D-tyrosyl-tRNA(Tyr) deacylase